MTWKVLQSPIKSPQFTNNFSSMTFKGNPQLEILKCWVALISELYLYILFEHNFIDTSQQTSSDVQHT